MDELLQWLRESFSVHVSHLAIWSPTRNWIGNERMNPIVRIASRCWARRIFRSWVITWHSWARWFPAESGGLSFHGYLLPWRNEQRNIYPARLRTCEQCHDWIQPNQQEVQFASQANQRWSDNDHTWDFSELRDGIERKWAVFRRPNPFQSWNQPNDVLFDLVVNWMLPT